MNKERFIRAIARYQNLYSHKETKMKLLEKAFGNDTTVVDFDGLEEVVQTIIDMAIVMFPNVSEKTIKDYIEYYIYEAACVKDAVVEEEDGTIWKLTSSDVLYDMLEKWNSDI